MTKAIALDPNLSISNWLKIIKACLSFKAKPKAAISYAIANKSINLLEYLFKTNKNQYTAKASNALRTLILDTIVNAGEDTPLVSQMATLLIEGGANPNYSVTVPETSRIPRLKGQTISFLEAAGELKHYLLVDSLLITKDQTGLLPTNPASGVFLAIQNRDSSLLSKITDKFDLADGNNYVESAVSLGPNHPLLKALLNHQAVASTKALDIAYSKQDLQAIEDMVRIGQAVGTPELMNKLIAQDAKDILRILRTTTTPDNSNFQAAALQNDNELFDILVASNGQIKEVKPLEIAINNRNEHILKQGLSIGWPVRGAIATEAIFIAIEAAWDVGIIACLTYGARPVPAVSFAIQQGNRDLLENILTNYNGDADRALAEALLYDQDALLETILSAGADPNLQLSQVASTGIESRVRILVDQKGNPALAMMGTIQHQNPPLVAYLIAKGADATPRWYLELALELQNTAIVDILLQNGADPRGLLELPVKNLNNEIVRLMLKRIQPDDEQKAEATEGLGVHLKYGNGEMLKVFIMFNADLNKHLNEASRRDGQLKVVEELVQQGADSNAATLGAVEGNQIEILHYLLKQGAEFNTIKFVQTSIEKEYPAILNELVRYGARMDSVLLAGNTYLHLAANKDTAEQLVKELLVGYAKIQPDFKRLALINQKNDAGDSPLHIAVALGADNFETVKLLVEAGADVNATNGDNRKVLYVAHSHKVVDFLKSHGAQGRTPRVNLES